MPVDRVVKNAGAYLKEHPDDPQGWYLLGRIHYAAFANRMPHISAYPNLRGDGQPPRTADWQRDPVDWGQRNEAMRRTLKKYGYATEADIPEKGKTGERFGVDMRKEWTRLKKEGWKAPEVSPSVTARHAVDGLAALDRSVSLDPKSALTHLTRASLLRETREWLPGAALKEVPPQLQAITEANVRSAFLAAWECSVEEELKAKTHPPFRRFTAIEAGRAWVELFDKAGNNLTDAEREVPPKVKRTLAQLESKPLSRIMSPVIFSIEDHSHSSLHGLLAPQTHVSFDLEGRGAVQTWPWIKPQTCLLVWDPDKTGIITSGRQLFGNATFQLVFRDGFEALRLLDDNRDGFLTGEELRGLAVWRDADSNGISTLSEVMPVEEAGIVSISVTAGQKEDHLHPFNPHGLTLRNGSTRPVWDWFASPLGR